MNTFSSIPVREILERARFAPSGDNMQPWLFHEEADGSLVLHRNRPIDLPEHPPYFMTGTFVGLGAFLESVVIAARHFGFRTVVAYNERFQEHDNFIARLQFIPDEGIQDPEEEQLFLALSERKTHRFVCHRRTLDSSSKEYLEKEAKAAGASLHFIEDPHLLRRFGEAWGLHDDFFWEHEILRENLVKTIRSNRVAKELRTGMPLRNLGLGLERHLLKSVFFLAQYCPWLWKFLSFRAKRTAVKLALGSAAFGFIFIPKKPGKKVFEEGFNSLDSTMGGRALQRVWLRATVEGLVIQPAYAFVAMVNNENNSELGTKFLTANRQMLIFLREHLPRIDEEMLVCAFRIGHPKKKNIPGAPRKQVNDIFRSATR